MLCLQQSLHENGSFFLRKGTGGRREGTFPSSQHQTHFVIAEGRNCQFGA